MFHKIELLSIFYDYNVIKLKIIKNIKKPNRSFHLKSSKIISFDLLLGEQGIKIQGKFYMSESMKNIYSRHKLKEWKKLTKFPAQKSRKGTKKNAPKRKQKGIGKAKEEII